MIQEFFQDRGGDDNNVAANQGICRAGSFQVLISQLFLNLSAGLFGLPTTLYTMAPIRRYLRISKYSVLECRIYLDNPSDSRWLLNPGDPVLPRVFAAIQPLVLPKLREENERLWSRKKGKPVKDVIAEGNESTVARRCGRSGLTSRSYYCR